MSYEPVENQRGLKAAETTNADANHRESLDSAHDDLGLLEEEDEREVLLTGRRAEPNPGFVTKHGRVSKRKTDGRAVRKEVLHRMEEGGSRSPTPSTDSGSDFGMHEKQAKYTPQSKKQRIFRLTAINIVIAGLFVLIAYGAFKATQSTERSVKPLDPASMLSNGTTLFAPTTIYISLDGFRADYLQRGISPVLAQFIRTGVSPKWMLPSFPSVTFPNHYTLVTGMYPESHGIVGNQFYAPEFNEEFYYTHTSISMQPKWWAQAEPVWETAEQQGVPAAIHMWPGSEAHIGKIEPTDVDKYNGSEVLSNKVHRILGFLDRPGPLDPLANAAHPRPQLIAAYVPNVDSLGHKFGPNSTEVDDSIRAVDEMLGDLFSGLEERNLTHVVNVVIVSDHGMASTEASRVLQLEDLVDVSLVKYKDGWPHYGLRPHDEKDIQTLYEQLVKSSENHEEAFDFFLREDIPARWNFRNNERIAPLWIFPRTGWIIATKDEFDVAAYHAQLAAGVSQSQLPVYHPKGVHGYDNAHPLMRSIFVARGPAFPHLPGSHIPVFTNVEVYNIICDSLRIEPKPNNGSLRLPFDPTGTHFDHDDFDHATSSHISGEQDEGKHDPQSVSRPSDSSSETEPEFGIQTGQAVPERPSVDDEPANDSNKNSQAAEASEDGRTKSKEIWEWIKFQTNEFAQWLKNLGKHTGIVGHHGEGDDATDVNQADS